MVRVVEQWRIEVDGIKTSVGRSEHPGPMFSLRDFGHGPGFELGPAAYLRCSRPYDSGDEKRWLAGDYDKDLDWWGHHPDD